jgi:CrcB protein
MAFLFVFIGGGCGSMLRYVIAKGLAPYHFQFPWATLLANALACILLGWLTAYSAKIGLPDWVRYTFMTGFCGGFSTFSTFAGETMGLLEQGDFLHAMTNVLGSIILCLCCSVLGMRLAC